MIEASHHTLGEYRLVAEAPQAILFTDNDTNLRLLYGVPNQRPFVKDAFHEAVVRGNSNAVNPEGIGTKAAAHFRMQLGAGEARSVRLRLQRIKNRDSVLRGV